MPEDIRNTSQKNDEIDLLDLFKRMGRTLSRWFTALGHAFLISVVFLIRRWLPLGLSIVLGVGASYLFKATFPPFYKSDLVLRNNTISNADMITYLNRLHTYCKEKNYNALEAAMAVSPQFVNNIIDIRAFWIIDKNRDGIPDLVDYKNKHDIYDTLDIRMQDRIDISVKVRSAQDFPEIRKGIISDRKSVV